ncbi:MAG: hypothetical protein OXJ53_15180 [Gammaproteobacteria bacterium]|nr:hypothetical protein [Gammaproteobacteria bacterium]MDE0271329.1 hypothetical protein [Gammaproteobacteria bacterium]
MCGGCLQSAITCAPRDEAVHTAHQLLRAYNARARNGDFAGAWSAHGQLVDHVRRTGLGEWLMYNYCPTGGCADIGRIAWNLGKTKADLEAMGRWGCLDSWQQGTCAAWERWFDVRKAYLSEAPAPLPNHPPQEVGLSFLHAKDHGDHRPWTVVELGDVRLWGVLDTGAYNITFRSDLDGLAEAHVPLGEPYAASWYSGAQDVLQSAVLGQFTLGSLVEARVPALAVRDVNDWFQNMAIIGNSVLFRYPRICFDWANSVLHLGRLGPCGEGVQLDQVGLRNGTSPVVRVQAPDGAPIDVLLDTGAPLTHCRDSFIQRMGGKRFRFGSHPDFEALCVADSETELHTASPEERPYGRSGLIGMDTLLKFDGFGWELNPFRVYLLPKS